MCLPESEVAMEVAWWMTMTAWEEGVPTIMISEVLVMVAEADLVADIIAGKVKALVEVRAAMVKEALETKVVVCISLSSNSDITVYANYYFKCVCFYLPLHWHVDVQLV